MSTLNPTTLNSWLTAKDTKTNTLPQATPTPTLAGVLAAAEDTSSSHDGNWSTPISESGCRM